MGERIKKGLKEVKTVLKSTAVFYGILTSGIIFLALYLLLILIKIEWYYAFFAWFPFTVWYFYHHMKKANYHTVEQQTPQLHEQLRTAADHKHVENTVTHALHEDVLRNLIHVKVTDFVQFPKLTKQLFILIILVFAILYVGSANVHFFDAKLLVKEIGDIQKAKYYPGATFDVPPIPEDESSIFGNKSLIELGTKELQLQITPILSDIDVSKIKPPEQQHFQENVPREILAVPEASYEENIPKEHQEIVKNYFSQIVKG